MFPLVALFAQSGAAANQPHALTVWQSYFLVVAGILVSILLPIFLRVFYPGAAAAAGGRWKAAMPYIAIGAASLVAAVIVLAFAGKEVQTWEWQNALLAGYAWDSTLQKVRS
jgi:Na+/melibiose symporter-like transporter